MLSKKPLLAQYLYDKLFDERLEVVSQLGLRELKARLYEKIAKNECVYYHPYSRGIGYSLEKRDHNFKFKWRDKK